MEEFVVASDGSRWRRVTVPQVRVQVTTAADTRVVRPRGSGPTWEEIQRQQRAEEVAAYQDLRAEIAERFDISNLSDRELEALMDVARDENLSRGNDDDEYDY